MSFRIFVGDSDNNLYALKPSATNDEDRLVWQHLTGDTIYSSPTVSPDGKVVYVGSDDNNLYALETSKLALKRVKWKFATEKGIDATPAVNADGSTVYIASYDKNIYAVTTDLGNV